MESASGFPLTPEVTTRHRHSNNEYNGDDLPTYQPWRQREETLEGRTLVESQVLAGSFQRRFERHGMLEIFGNRFSKGLQTKNYMILFYTVQRWCSGPKLEAKIGIKMHTANLGNWRATVNHTVSNTVTCVIKVETNLTTVHRPISFSQQSVNTKYSSAVRSLHGVPCWGRQGVRPVMGDIIYIPYVRGSGIIKS